MNKARDNAAKFLNWLECYERAKRANDSRAARFALHAVTEVHLMMLGRSSRFEAIEFMHRIIGDPMFTPEKVGEMYDQLRRDALLGPAS